MTTSTTTTTFTTKLKTFNGTGFPAWWTQVRMILELWDACQDPAPSSADVKAAKSAAAAASAAPATPGSSLLTSATPLYDRLMKKDMSISIILAALSEEAYLLPHPMKVMHHLRMTYNVKCTASIGATKREYMGLYLDGEASMMAHIQVTRRVLDELQELHGELDDDKKRHNFMHSLGPAWNGFIGVLESPSTLEDMLNRCQAEVIRRTRHKGRRSTSRAASGGGKAAAAFNTDVKDSKSNNMSSKKKLDASKIKCFNCQKMGHFARDCTNEHVAQGATKAGAASMAFSVDDGGRRLSTAALRATWLATWIILSTFASWWNLAHSRWLPATIGWLLPLFKLRLFEMAKMSACCKKFPSFAGLHAISSLSLLHPRMECAWCLTAWRAPSSRPVA
ncbi:hypothetical protein PF008_g20378 [Phytophthora fragariae]|uniref:CCHC-type domain-containing protein n=1 Tax=Phytophthora fragariae TaxID=53985 RepID=A0A6G0R0S1_9STRA|nr:hypothetical protein PF008_g20378 [Phytophthora fragariae]